MTALEARKLAEDEIKAGKTPKYTDLRDWLEIVDSFGELKLFLFAALSPQNVSISQCEPVCILIGYYFDTNSLPRMKNRYGLSFHLPA